MLDLYHNNNMIGFSRHGLSVALEPDMELALVDQAGLELTQIHLHLPPECLKGLTVCATTAQISLLNYLSVCMYIYILLRALS